MLSFFLLFAIAIWLFQRSRYCVPLIPSSSPLFLTPDSRPDGQNRFRPRWCRVRRQLPGRHPHLDGHHRHFGRRIQLGLCHVPRRCKMSGHFGMWHRRRQLCNNGIFLCSVVLFWFAFLFSYCFVLLCVVCVFNFSMVRSRT